MIRNLIFRGLFVLALMPLMLSGYLYAQSIEEPKVTFSEPPTREFEINDSLHLHLQSDTPANKLRARVFWGRKEDLIDTVKKAPANSCLYFPSFVVPFESANGEVKFGWQFKAYSLKQVNDESFGNQAYTVVLEKNNGKAPLQFHVYPKAAEDYFQSGQDIVLIAPPNLQSGAGATVAAVQKIRAAESQSAVKGSSPAIPGVPVLAEPCMVVKTRHIATTAELQLLSAPCRDIELENDRTPRFITNAQ